MSELINYTDGLLTKCEVKMAGYWPSGLSFASSWIKVETRFINVQKATRPIPSHFDLTLMIHYVEKTTFLMRYSG